MDFLEQLDEELIRKRHILEEHLPGAMLLMGLLEDAAERAKLETFSLNPFSEPEKIRERQILYALVTQQLPRMIENIMNAGDGEKVWRYGELRER